MPDYIYMYIYIYVCVWVCLCGYVCARGAQACVRAAVWSLSAEGGATVGTPSLTQREAEEDPQGEEEDGTHDPQAGEVILQDPDSATHTHTHTHERGSIRWWEDAGFWVRWLSTMWVCIFSGFLQQSKDMQLVVRLLWDSRMVYRCESLFISTIRQWPVQWVFCLVWQIPWRMKYLILKGLMTATRWQACLVNLNETELWRTLPVSALKANRI